LAGKPRFCRHSENQVHCNDDAFVPEFSEGNSGSSFLNENGPLVRCLACFAKRNGGSAEHLLFVIDSTGAVFRWNSSIAHVNSPHKESDMRVV
jgi:hypothetical protein